MHNFDIIEDLLNNKWRSGRISQVNRTGEEKERFSRFRRSGIWTRRCQTFTLSTIEHAPKIPIPTIDNNFQFIFFYFGFNVGESQ
jgi:hypothetical protein